MASKENQEALNNINKQTCPISEHCNGCDNVDKCRNEYAESINKLQQAIDDLEVYKKALLNSCLYTTELNSYHNKSDKERLKRAKEYAKEYLEEARKELESDK